MRYPAKIERIEGEYIATISHKNGRFQGVASGQSAKHAAEQLGAVIDAMIASAIKDGEEIPAASQCERGNGWAYASPIIAAKAGIYMEMRTHGKRKKDLVRGLNINAKQVDRILDPAHRSTLAQLQSAAAFFGKHLDVRLA